MNPATPPGSHSEQVRAGHPPPRLVVRALTASFATVTVILIAVFTLISLDARQRVRQSVIANLDAGQQAAARMQRERQQDLQTMVSLLAESPTLKAALDTWQSERGAASGVEDELVETVQREADKIAARVGAPVLALLDIEGRIVVSAGPRAGAWPRGAVLRPRGQEDDATEFVTRIPAGAFRVIGAPLRLGEAVIGSVEIGRAIDQTYADDLAALARGDSAVIIDDHIVATTLPAAVANVLVASLQARAERTSFVVDLVGESYAISVAPEPSATFVTLASIDAAAAGATSSALTRLAWIAAAAALLAGVGSFWLAHTLTRPIDQLSAAVTDMTMRRRFDAAVPPTGSSRELDALAGTFNDLIRAVADAEAQTQAAYFGAIRALAAALDARDPYTAGHSERVSMLAVEIGRAMVLSDDDVDVLRLGALLHDIGKIGVPDDVLRKPAPLTSAEFELIRAHPVIGARILRSIPFLAAHLPIVELHHERPDGSGYPYGMVGDAIPLAARIVHVADAYDAMTSARAYRPGRSPQEAIAELHRGAGSDFDAVAVEALVRALPTLPAFEASFDPLAFRFQAGGSGRSSRAGGSGRSGGAGGDEELDSVAPAHRSLTFLLLVAASLLLAPQIATAQSSAAALDVVAAADSVAHSTPARPAGIWLDVFGAVRIADGVEVVARPVISRRTFDGTWQKQMYQLGVRYEHRGANDGDVGVRVEIGQMPSPIGIGMLENRADLNPVVSQHSAYYLPLPRVDPEIPRTFLIAGAYPFGALATVSAGRWDARVAALDSSPVRGRPFFGTNKPPRLLNTVAGVGFTPRVGVRVGLGVAHGAYASVDEVADRGRGDRDATMFQLEGEWSFAYTRIVGEWVHSVMETARAAATATGGWVEVTHTLHPRLFVAGRVDAQHFDYQRPVYEDLLRQRYDRVESVAGVRVTPDVTLRVGYLGRKGYVVSHWDDQLIASIVWQRKVW